jgi:hypothetical protein
MMKLFKVSVIDTRNRFNKPKPIYAVAENKEAAKEYVSRHIKTGYQATAVSYLGEQLAVYMYSANEGKS